MAHRDLNELKDALLPVAKQMLAEHGEFFPYGAFMKLNGEIVSCTAADPAEHPPSNRLIEILTRDFQQRAAKGEIVAAAICSDVRVLRPGETAKVDAVQFALEHKNGEACDMSQAKDQCQRYNDSSSTHQCWQDRGNHRAEHQ